MQYDVVVGGGMNEFESSQENDCCEVESLKSYECE